MKRLIITMLIIIIILYVYTTSINITIAENPGKYVIIHRESLGQYERLIVIENKETEQRYLFVTSGKRGGLTRIEK
jgi:hypothetical protein